ncbi:tRNA (N6-isopentenyl adenosine(37)-C2)-methylthiotransferase MiaB, partial [Francisella tularensis subsp. holarctica]|nr:tRNA (N6-isopentenyl adenosine(37)-C2)-methylthiotransferase MiaB [Francisella tularensis subsp. holarctica]
MNELKKVFTKTVGCQKNEYDSARMQEGLNEHFDTVKTDDYKDAHIILMNTCSIREKAQEKVFHERGRRTGLKKTN